MDQLAEKPSPESGRRSILLKVACGVSAAAATLSALGVVGFYTQGEEAAARAGAIDPPSFPGLFILLVIMIFATILPVLYLSAGEPGPETPSNRTGARASWVSNIRPAIGASIIAGILWPMHGAVLDPYGFIKFFAFFIQLPVVLFVSVFLALCLVRRKNHSGA